MTVVVGVSPVHGGRDSIHLAGMLARSTGSDLLVVAVVPAPWPGRTSVDLDYRAYLRSRAEEALTRVRETLPEDLTAQIRVHESVSVSEGLVEVTRAVAAPLLVLGSSSMGLLGRVGLGSVTERLLHSSPVPVAVAPRGFTVAADRRVTRVNTAYAVGRDEQGVLAAATELADRMGATVRLVTFAVRPPGPISSGVGLQVEDEVLDTWSERAASVLRSAQADVDRRVGPERHEDPVIGRGGTWQRSLESVPWGRGDVLVVGSSRSARSAQVFLGSTASKIARSFPAPVVVVPRGAELGPGAQ